ncbi:MAG TPA: efflux RND transporter periplasmic adaptor subunit [Candidatus Hydrogenedens sp.]|nr:efflux RND transporter periplasmic adaptor subunit [Candidatus Hydrogenedens sp.]HOK08310.1 efflux RND transporter periplasmic adaptor subunit [Candidatus Hydrogenedens sp.]HOL18896.1 efflux RND transporter periplasmic adaptor subunit [Candidatus Hydrogenedens sp.]HPP57604.1 efflux RND transporter periplasmic adaptor subunit [Candidatus Hydrogenedens sp.]
MKFNNYYIGYFFIAILFLFIQSCENPRKDIFIVSGQIECKVHTPGSTIGGRIIKIYVNEGDTVKKDQSLIQFDCAQQESMYQSALAGVKRAEALVEKLKKGATEEELRQAEKAVASAEAQYKLLLAGAREEDKKSAKAALDSAQATYEIAKKDYERAERLYNEGAISKKEWEQTKILYEKVQAEYRVAEEKYKQLQKGARDEEIEAAKSNWERTLAILDEVKRGPRIEDIRSAESALESARAELARMETILKECLVTSPIDGIVESISVREGNIIPPGACIRIVNPDDLEMFIYVPAYVLGYLSVGQVLNFRTDAYGEEEFSGKVIYIASEGEFTPRNLQTQEERIQQVFAVKLALTSYNGRLRAGMTATVKIPLTK